MADELTLEGKNEDTKLVKKKIPTYYRQMPLLEEVRAHQRNCDHTLQLTNQQLVVCESCNAVWLR